MKLTIEKSGEGYHLRTETRDLLAFATRVGAWKTAGFEWTLYREIGGQRRIFEITANHGRRDYVLTTTYVQEKA